VKLRRRDESPRERERRRRISVSASFRHRCPGSTQVSPTGKRGEHSPLRSLRCGETTVDALALGIGGATVPPNTHRIADSLSEPPREPPETGDIGDRIRLLEARLDSLLQHAASTEHPGPPAAPAPAPPPTPPETGPDDNVADGSDDDVRIEPDSVRGGQFYRRMWGAAGHRRRAEHVDEFGLDPDYEARYARPLLNFLYRFYFRVRTVNIEHVPSAGRCLIVANHSGTLPLDGPMLRTGLRRDHPSQRELRWLAEDFLYHLPFAGTTITRTGAVRACNENAERLLRGEHCVAVFPEGVRGISKLYRERYQLQRFGRGGFVRLALRTGTPIVPCAIIGAEETGPLLYREEMLSRWFGLPYLPVTPTFPWLGPVGLVPAPTRWIIYFGPPLSWSQYGPGAAGDDVLVGRLAQHVREQIRQMIDEGLKARRNVWLG